MDDKDLSKGERPATKSAPAERAGKSKHVESFHDDRAVFESATPAEEAAPKEDVAKEEDSSDDEDSSEDQNPAKRLSPAKKAENFENVQTKRNAGERARKNVVLRKPCKPQVRSFFKPLALFYHECMPMSIILDH